MKEKKGIFTIRIKMYLFVLLTVFAVALGTAAIAYYTSVDQIDKYYKRCAADNARNFASMVDGDYLLKLRKVAESDEYQQLREKAEKEENEELIRTYLEEKGLWEEYADTQKMINTYIKNMDSIKYLYLIVPGGTDAVVDMYLVDDYDEPIYETGYYEEREEELIGLDLTVVDEPKISNGGWGWLCSAFKPVYASDGTFVCLAGCDFGMDDVMRERNKFFMYMVAGALLFTLIVLIGAMLFIDRIIVKPLNTITKEMKKFKPSGRISYKDAGVIDIKLKSNDEITEIYKDIRTMQIEIIDYLNDLSSLEQDKIKAERDIEDKDKQIGKLSEETYKDALTGVGSKSAYVKKIAELNELILRADTEFALVMVDLNNLKQMNDSYGHKAGDQYIIGCCQMVCETFKHSPVYRIGGDEFVVILQGKDYNRRQELFEKLRGDFERSYCREQSEPSSRYSAALGMAENAYDDVTVEFVFKRADKAMYEDKMRFKSKYGSYR